VSYNVDPDNGLSGIPPICVVEAKKSDWQFGKFDRENLLFIKQMKKISVLDDNDEPSNLQKLFDTLNWLFDQANKVEIIRNN
jgi:hypothetical protein